MTNAEKYTVLGEEFGEVGHELNEAIGPGKKVDARSLRAELIQVAVMHSVVNHADHKEHCRRRDAVSDHLEHRAVHPHQPEVATDGAKPVLADEAFTEKLNRFRAALELAATA